MLKILVMLFACMLTACSGLNKNVNHQINDINDLYTLNPKSARAQLVLLKEQHPDDPNIWVTSGYLSLNDQDIARARVAFNKAVKLDPYHVRALMGQGICSDKLKQHAAAQGYYQQALAIEPGHVAVTNNLAMSYLMSDQVEKAIKLLEPLVSITEKNLNNKVHFNLSLAYAMNGQLALARQMLVDLSGTKMADQQMQHFLSIKAQANQVNEQEIGYE